MAMRALGEMALLGRGLNRDPDLAMRLLRQGAEQGGVEEKLALVRLLDLGAPNTIRTHSQQMDWIIRNSPGRWATGNEQADRAAAREALDWRIRAARQGHLESLLTVGSMLLGGTRNGTIEANEAEGLRWLLRAAMAGDPRATESLIRFDQERGQPEEAYYWLEVIASTGLSTGSHYRSVLENRLTDAQRAAARTRAAGFRPITAQEAANLQLDVAVPTLPRRPLSPVQQRGCEALRDTVRATCRTPGGKACSEAERERQLPESCRTSPAR
jgi:TPR repeat protein